MAATAEVAIQSGLSNISRAIAPHIERLSNATMSFKEAAAQHNRSISAIVKDISSSMAAQRRNLDDTEETISEAFSGIQKGFYSQSRATDALNDGIQRVVEVQYRTLGELSRMGSYLQMMMYNTSSNILGGVFGTALGSVFGSNFSSLTSALKIAFPFMVAGAAGYGLGQMAGGAGGGGAALGPGLGQSGSSSEAVGFFQSKGWSKEQAAGIVGNLQAESGKNLRTDARGDNGQAYGIAQWHPDRQARFQQVMGVPIRQSTFQQQLQFVDWELKNSEKQAGNILKSAQSAEQAASLLDKYYERSSGAHRGERMSNARALMNVKGESSPTTPATPTAGVTTPGSITNNTTTTNTTTNVTPSSTAAGPTQIPAPVGPMGQINPESAATGGNGRLPESMLANIGAGHKLQPSAAQAYTRMEEAARKDGITWSITDSYRDYASQVRLAQQKGLYSQGGLAATPGKSNHGWGLAVDLGSGANQKGSKQNEWLQRNAASFGFSTIPREPWHWEFKGGATGMAGATGLTGQTGGAVPDAVPDGAMAPTDTGQQIQADPRLTSGDPGQIMQVAQEQAAQYISSTGATMPTPGMGSMGGLGGMGMRGGLGAFGGSISGILGSVLSSFGTDIQQPAAELQPTPQTTAQQLQPQLQTAAKIQTAALEEKVAQMQPNSDEKERRETSPEQVAGLTQRHIPQGSFSDYNVDNHLYPDWPSMILGIHGRHTGSNIKTTLA